MAVVVDEVKRVALDSGADLVGVASDDRFGEAPEGHRPWDILSGARAVVVCGVRIPGGTLEGPATAYHNAMTVAHGRLDRTAALVAVFLETHGARAVPVPADEPYRHWEAGRAYGRGDLSHKHAAVAAGLGWLGKNSLLIAPGFGNRLHLVSVVTDLDLAPDAAPRWKGCPRECTLCVEACPAGALGEGPTVAQDLCRRVLMERLPRGALIESCRCCRRVCPAGLR